MKRRPKAGFKPSQVRPMGLTRQSFHTNLLKPCETLSDKLFKMG